MEKNILCTALSLPKTEYSYSVIDNEEGVTFVTGNYESEEPGAKYILSMADIHRIVIVGSAQTICKGDPIRIPDLVNYYKENFGDSQPYIVGTGKDRQWKHHDNVLSSYLLLVYRLGGFLVGMKDRCDEECVESERVKMLHPHGNMVNHPVEIVFVPDKIEDSINYGGMIRMLRGTKEVAANIYMDTQGSDRSFTFARNIILQMMVRQNIYHMNLKMVTATKWNYSEKRIPDADNVRDFINRIVNETDNYRIAELFSGISSLLEYGKINDIENYLSHINHADDRMNNLTKYMKMIESALAKNDTSALGNASLGLKEALNTFDAGGYSAFDVLVDGIRSDYEPILRDNYTVIDILEWCISKKMYLTAAAVLESQFPAYLFTNKILNIPYDEAEKAEKYMMFYRECVLDKKERYKLDDPYHFLIKNYIPHFHGSFLHCTREYTNYASSAFTIEMDKKNEKIVQYLLVAYDIASLIRNSFSHAAKPNDLKKTSRLIKGRLKGLPDLQDDLLDLARIDDFEIDASNSSEEDFRVHLLGLVIKDIVVLTRRLAHPDVRGSILNPIRAYNEDEVAELIRYEMNNRVPYEMQRGGNRNSYIGKHQNPAINKKPCSYILGRLLAPIYDLPVGLMNEESWKNYARDEANHILLDLYIPYYNSCCPDEMIQSGNIEDILRNPQQSMREYKRQESARIQILFEDSVFMEKLRTSEKPLKEIEAALENLNQNANERAETDLKLLYGFIKDREHNWKAMLRFWMSTDLLKLLDMLTTEKKGRR